MSGRGSRRILQDYLPMIQEPEEKLILIDTDAGTDDAWALFMALAAHKASSTTGVRIVGITTVCGNTTVENVSKNVTRTLETANEGSIPIYQGLSDFVMKEFTFFENPPYHGEDGFGDADLPPISARLESEHAVNAIIRLAEEYKDRLTIVALGPLTNLAMAVKIKPEIKNWIKEIFILGGNMHGLGNVSSSAEFNFFVDPEAAAITVDTYRPLQMTILPWETAFAATSPLEFRNETLGRLNTPEIQLLNAIEAKNLGAPNRTTWLPPDAVVMVCAINLQAALETKIHYAKVELTGTHTRGMLAVDKANFLRKGPNVKLISSVDQEVYKNYIIWAAGGPTPEKLQLCTHASNTSSSNIKRPRRNGDN